MRNFIATLFLFLLSLFSASSFATTYYLSSSSGNDNNSGTDPSSAWQSIDKLNSFGLQPGDNVLFKRGDTFYGSITVNQSGSNGNPITYGAFGSGAKPVISGFTNVTSWTNLGGNIWESTDAVSTLPYTNMVSVNGVNTAMGRFPNSTGPNTGYITIASHSGSFSITAAGGLGSTNWTGAGIVIRKERWALERGTITSQSGNTLNFQDPNIDNPQDGFGFFIQNDPKTLDVNGEWYYNPSNHKLRIFSTSSPSNVQIATVENLVVINVKSNIVLDNIAFMGANSAGINCLEYGGNNLTIQNCDVSFTGQEGIISLEDNTIIQNNNVSHTNSSGIYTSQANCLIQNNNLKNINMLEGMNKNVVSPGIQNYGANTVIQNNVLDSLGYMGISFSGLNVSVKNNFVKNICFIKDDGGGICMGGRDRAIGSVIDGNIVLNAIGAAQGSPGNSTTDASGIMIDGYGKGITIINNTTANCANSGIKLLEDQDITLRNNTSYNNGLNSSWATGGIELLSGSDLEIRNVTMEGNIFVARTANQVSFFGYGSSGSTSDLLQFGSFDNNYYAKPIDQNTAIWANSNNYTLGNWQSYSGKDANSNGSPKSISDVNDLRFEYNASSSPKTVTLDANYIDVKNVSYNGSITLQPYTSAVLIRNGAKSANEAPVANAGSNQVIQLPSNLTLTGSGSDADGSIASYLWSQNSGPSNATVSGASSSQASVTDLVPGSYVFELQVTDDKGATGTADVTVTVKAANISSPNIAPTANVGDDRSIQLPKNNIVLPGSGSDADGSVVSYSWSQISGPSSATLTNQSSAQAGASDLVAGTYIFQLTVTDDKGATGTSNLRVDVNSDGSNNIAPIVNVGSDRNIYLPKNSIVLPGSAIDKDGSVVSYLWSQISGPSSATMVNPTSAQAGAGNLVQGQYQFRLTATDDRGAIGNSILNVTVNPPTNSALVVSAGSDRVIQLPKNSVVLPGSAYDDPNATIISYSWTQITGPSSATIINGSSAQAGAGNLVQGVYQFQFRVEDNQGAVGTAVIEVVVNSPNSSSPVAYVGDDRVLQLPKNSIVLPGSGSDANGTIVSYSWSQLSGPSTATLINASSANAGAGDLVQGTYIFELTVTDDHGATGSAVLNVTVNGANRARMATDQSTNLNQGTDNSTTISGTNVETIGQDSSLAIQPKSLAGTPQPAQLSIYPNPAHDFINLQISGSNISQNAEVSIVDINGRTVLKKALAIASPTVQQLDVSQLNAGTYIVTVTSGGAPISSAKMVKL